MRQEAAKQLQGKKSAKSGSFTKTEMSNRVKELEGKLWKLETQNKELLLAEEASKKALTEYIHLYEHAPVSYFIFNKQGLIKGTNLSGVNMLMKDRNKLLNHYFRKYIEKGSLDAFNGFLYNIFETGARETCEVCLNIGDSDPFYVHMAGVVSTGGETCYVTAVDITERQQYEDELKNSEKQLREINASKDKFFSIISHDLRSPFSSIIGFSNLLIEKVREKDYKKVEEYASIVQNSSWRVMNLLVNLIEWSSSQTGRMEFNPEFFDIVELINEVVELSNDSARPKSITLKKELPHSIFIMADKDMTSTILRNLISNAIKYTNHEGEIIISALQIKGNVKVSIIDNGVGILKESIEKLFRIQDSHSTKGTLNETGTGLGLLLCKEFIEKHDGKLWVESEPDKGSKFHFTLPLTRKDKADI
jgi:signal transduction histidine kinase